MAGYVLQGFYNKIVSAGSTVIFTVPTGHRYMIRGLSGSLKNTNAASGSLKFQVSDLSSANPEDITPLISTDSTDQHSKFFSLATPGSASSDAPNNSTNSVYANGMLDHMILEAGQELIAVDTETNCVKAVQTSVIDYTI